MGRHADLGDALRRTTRFRVVCPECGRAGIASWTRQENVVSCRGCGHQFDYHGHTYRPLTGGMTEEERAEREREWRREYERTPERLRAHAERSRVYYREHREEIAERSRARYQRNRARILAQQREHRARNRDDINRKRRERYASKKHEVKLARVRRELERRRQK